MSAEAAVAERNLKEAANAITRIIKNGLNNKSMSQVELSKLIGEGPQQINRAVHGDLSPKSITIRQKIYKVI